MKNNMLLLSFFITLILSINTSLQGMLITPHHYERCFNKTTLQDAFYCPAINGDIKQILHYAQVYGEHINTPDKDGYTLLDHACLCRNTRTAQALIEKCGALVNVDNAATGPKRRQTPLHSAVVGGNINIVYLLLEKGAKIDSSHHDEGSTPLHIAAWLDFANITSSLILEGANINALNKHGSSPVHCAAWRNSFASLRVLLDHNAESCFPNNTGNGNTPLYLAAKAGSIESLRMLLLHKNTAQKTINLICSGIGDDATALGVTLIRKHYQCSWDLMRCGAPLGGIQEGIWSQNKPHKRDALIKRFLNSAIHVGCYESFLNLKEISLNAKFTHCDMCKKQYCPNDVVMCFSCGNKHSSHHACFAERCIDEYYHNNERCFLLQPEDEAKKKIGLVVSLSMMIAGGLTACSQKDCDAVVRVNKCQLKVCQPTINYTQ